MRQTFLIALCTAALLTAVLCTAALIATVAHMPSAHAHGKKNKEALQISAQAKAAFAAGRYDDAAHLFMKAYASVPEPTLVYNAARAYQKGGRGAEALPLFRLYLSIAGKESQSGRDDARRHIAEIEKRLRAQQARQAHERRQLEKKAAAAGRPLAARPPAGNPPAGNPPATSPRPQPVLSQPKPVTRPGMTPTGRTVVHRPDQFQRVSRGKEPPVLRAEQLGAWTARKQNAAVVGGIGVVALLTGITLHAIDTDLEKIDERTKGTSFTRNGRTFYPGVTQREADEALSSHNLAATIGNILIASGLAAGGVAAWLWLTDEQKVALQLQPRNGGALVLVGGRF